MSRTMWLRPVAAVPLVVGVLTATPNNASAIPPPPVLRYIYDTHSTTAAANGWNLLDTGSDKTTIDQLPAGSRALVWIGDYSNTTCSFQMTRNQVVAELTPLVGDPKVAGYFISDEPDPNACPTAYSQHTRRSNLVHSIDSTKFTLIVLDSNSGNASLNQMAGWAGIGDYQGLDPYPCYVGNACNFPWIDTVIAKANAVRLHYWGVVQSFRDSTWRWPTVDELNHMLGQWSASSWQGLATFAWRWAGHCLCSNAALLEAWDVFNTNTVQSRPATPPSPSPTGSPYPDFGVGGFEPGQSPVGREQASCE
jgi:hypothetical protein